MRLYRIFSDRHVRWAAIFCAIAALGYAGHSTADSFSFVPTVHAAPDTSGGIVPCGRETDNPNTENNETDKCTLCHLALIANNTILFFFSIASILAVLMFIVAALMYLFVGANPVAKNQAREAAMNVVKGYLVVFTAWLIVDFVLSAWGFIDPLGGTWSVVCD